MMFLRIFFFLSYFGSCERTIISLGGLLPLSNSSDCAPAWARWYIATEAVSIVTSSSWWPKQHLSLALECIGSSESSPVDSILHEATFAGITSGQVPKCQLVSREVCSVARVGMFSLGSSASIQGIDVAYTAPISLVTAGARSNKNTKRKWTSSCPHTKHHKDLRANVHHGEIICIKPCIIDHDCFEPSIHGSNVILRKHGPKVVVWVVEDKVEGKK